MGKPTGFMDYTRQELGHRSVSERINDWQEVKDCLLQGSVLQEQAARCMECSLPFCHTGELVGNNLIGCPLHNLMPEINDFAYQNLTAFAYRRLRKQNNFPEFTGRVCPAPCESACSVGLVNNPVCIRSIELSLAEQAFADGIVKPRPPKARTGKKVAIIGAGPSGLAAADILNKLGHTVTVYERDDRPGGLLMYGIPNMKLDKSVIARRVNIIAAEGVEFVYNTEIGKHLSADSLLHSFDAIILCIGSTIPRDLNIQGRDLSGIHFAKDYLHAATAALLNGKSVPKDFDARGKDVIVIGGGDTGTDCVATAIRQACKSVKQLEIMPCLPTARSKNTQWPFFPQLHKIDYGQEEALELYNTDPREYCVCSKAFVGNKKVSGVQTVKINWQGREMQEVSNTDKLYKADIVLLAMGFVGADTNLVDAFKLNKNTNGTIATRDNSFATEAEKVFVAGDAKRGQSLVVWAIAEGRQAANECHQFLSK